MMHIVGLSITGLKNIQMMDIKVMNNIINPIYYKCIYRAITKGYDPKKALWSISPDQMQSKTWLIDELKNLPLNNITVQLFGGWFGWPLIDLLNENFDIKAVENIDLDPIALAIFRTFSNLNSFEKNKMIATENSVLSNNILDEKADLVINTSGEHMPDLPELIKDKNYKKHCIFAIQSNNMFYLEEHINCVNSKEELEHKSGLSRILYSGSLDMQNGYQRYMVIGLR